MDPILALLLALSITGLLCFWGLALAWLLDRYDLSRLCDQRASNRLYHLEREGSLMSDDLLWLTVMVMGAIYTLVIGGGLLAIAYIIRRTRRT
jgi:hypothetical protein